MQISTEETLTTKENQPQEEEEELITDFSNMFKGKALARKPKRQARQAEPTPNWLLEIPVKLQITKEQLCQRKVLNQKRWKSLVKSTQTTDMLVASAASAWNYLFSTRGLGSLEYLTLKQAKAICESFSLSYKQQDDYKRAEVIMACFNLLCIQAKVNALSKVILKPSIPNQISITEEQGLNGLLEGLKQQDTFYVFPTYNNIMCPIGFDKTPLVPLDAFRTLQEIDPNNIELWIVNASIQRLQPSFVSKRWKDVYKSLVVEWPYFIDLEQAKKGQQLYQSASEVNRQQKRGNSFCIMQFKRLNQ